jgi:hypothetical protein
MLLPGKRPCCDQYFKLPARALLLVDRGKAKAAYEDFLKLWKDADQDIPILKEAKAEHDRL